MQQLTLGEHFGLNKNKVQLNGIVINEAVIDASANVPWHYHENAYFLYNRKGSFLEVNKQDQITCLPNTLLYHNWQEPHCNRNITEESDYFHIEIEKNWFNRHGLDPDVLQGSMNILRPDVKTLFQKISMELDRQDAVTSIAVDGLLLNAFSLIIRNEHKPSIDREPQWVRLLKELLVESHPNDLNLNRLASDLGITPVHLSRSFARYFNMSLGNYIRLQKINRAKILLDTEVMSNSQIAYDCGFSDESHFIKSFKSYFGIAPGQYKKGQF